MKIGLLVLAFAFLVSGASNFYIGAGRGDITGPAAEIGMMGYAAVDQKTAGIHFRQYARAFVFVDPKTQNRIAYVNLDLAFVTIMVKKQVITQLNTIFPGVYTQANVLLTATHTHSGPGGYSWYTMYDITTWGWKKINVDSIVTGIVDAITKAHKSLQPGNAFIQTGTLADPMTNRNRSPTAYANNPASELKNYTDNVDKESVVLKLVSESGVEIGAMNWFAVHGTSMNKTNKHISGDNKGYAMYLFEEKKNPGALPGQGNFVASFSNSNEGDSSPNTKGAFCPNGQPCDPVHSTCNGRVQDCIAIGPGADMLQSTQIIGLQQYTSAYGLYTAANTPLKPGVASAHQWADMQNVVVQPAFSGLASPVSTCLAALGDSFAAGTTDGPGEFNFIQGNNNTGNPFWNFIAGFLSRPSEAQKACHAPKPILLNTGGCTVPTPWTPSTLPLQVFSIGQLYIVGVPGEFTTMSGRRLRKTVREAVLAAGAPADAIVVIAGLANAYSQYTTTHEEYAVQRYEGASTLFGPNQLAAYQQLYYYLSYNLAKNGSNPNPGTAPADYTKDLIDLQPGVWFDDGPIGKVINQVAPSYKLGQTVSVKFYTGHPNNNVRRPTFMTVEQQQADGKSYKVIATDANWETTYTWERIPSIILAESAATLQWTIPFSTTPGLYRITHYGDKKAIITGKITPFEAHSGVFSVTA